MYEPRIVDDPINGYQIYLEKAPACAYLLLTLVLTWYFLKLMKLRLINKIFYLIYGKVKFYINERITKWHFLQCVCLYCLGKKING